MKQYHRSDYKLGDLVWYYDEIESKLKSANITEIHICCRFDAWNVPTSFVSYTLDKGGPNTFREDTLFVSREEFENYILKPY